MEREYAPSLPVRDISCTKPVTVAERVARMTVEKRMVDKLLISLGRDYGKERSERG